VSILDDQAAERCYTWWRKDYCPACGCMFFRKDRGRVIAELVKVCECCTSIPDNRIEVLLRQLARGAQLYGGPG
jgi:hypothetical protein